MLTSPVEIKEAGDKIRGLVDANIDGYFIVDGAGQIKQRGGLVGRSAEENIYLPDSLPMLQNHLEHPDKTGAFYRISGLFDLPENSERTHSVYIGPVPGEDQFLGLIYNADYPFPEPAKVQSEIFILSLITQAVRAFNRAENLESILKIVLIGVTAGSGLGFNRAFVFLTSDKQKNLRGALANGPSSHAEAEVIWRRLSRGELNLEQLFNDALSDNGSGDPPMNDFLRTIVIPLDNKDNIFARAALEKRSMIIDQATLASAEYADLNTAIGHGPLALVPLIGRDYLQGVLIADNFITGKKITDNDLHLLEIFARYASDSIKNFRLYNRLERKIKALKQANETIINSRENVIKAERLSVLAEMAGEVAHEIRNPLTVIGGFAKSMLRKMPKDNENFEYLDIIFQQVQRIGDSLEKFTSLINYESKSDVVCDLADLVSSAVAVRVPGSDFTQFDVVSDQQIKIKIDPDLFRQALLIVMKQVNAISNNIGHIALAIRRNEDKALIYFEPAGQDDDFASRLYKSFQSGGNHEVLRQLSTTLEILKFYRGNIAIESGEHDPNKFYLELPVFEEER